jgi:hypothetical protein
MGWLPTDTSPGWIVVIGYVGGLVGAVLLARKKNLPHGFEALGLLGLMGLVFVALLPARCDACSHRLTPAEFESGTCPRCRPDPDERAIGVAGREKRAR